KDELSNNRADLLAGLLTPGWRQRRAEHTQASDETAAQQHGFLDMVENRMADLVSHDRVERLLRILQERFAENELAVSGVRRVRFLHQTERDVMPVQLCDFRCFRERLYPFAVQRIVRIWPLQSQLSADDGGDGKHEHRGDQEAYEPRTRAKRRRLNTRD